MRQTRQSTWGAHGLWHGVAMQSERRKNAAFPVHLQHDVQHPMVALRAAGALQGSLDARRKFSEAASDFRSASMRSHVSSGTP